MADVTPTTTASTVAASCTSNLYELPIADAACAIPVGGNHTDIMTTCCGSADVVSYDDCGLYCLAEGQSVSDLTKCLFANGASYSVVFCNAANATASATGTDSLPTGTAASGVSIVATGSGSAATSAGGGGGSSTSGTASGSTPSSSKNAAAGTRPAGGAGMAAVMTVGMLVSATVFGALIL
ncbi:hypothetical protein BX600DRAFT_497293 [Xylariales sp. PMI_506]|nr:hypothetical protein BX600DRAFT_497293 [Xylariales sp. PMI_506]